MSNTELFTLATLRASSPAFAALSDEALLPVLEAMNAKLETSVSQAVKAEKVKHRPAGKEELEIKPTLAQWVGADIWESVSLDSKGNPLKGAPLKYACVNLNKEYGAPFKLEFPKTSPEFLNFADAVFWEMQKRGISPETHKLKGSAKIGGELKAKTGKGQGPNSWTEENPPIVIIQGQTILPFILSKCLDVRGIKKALDELGILPKEETKEETTSENTTND